MKPRAFALWAASAVLAHASCHAKEPVSPSTTPAGAPACDKLADHLIALMRPEGAAPETVDTIRRTITRRCFEDKWTIDALQCFGQAKAIEGPEIQQAGERQVPGISQCATLLTVEQRNAFAEAFADALDSNRAR